MWWLLVIINYLVMVIYWGLDAILGGDFESLVVFFILGLVTSSFGFFMGKVFNRVFNGFSNLKIELSISILFSIAFLFLIIRFLIFLWGG